MTKKLVLFIIFTFIIVIIGIDYKPQTVENKPDAYEVIKYMDNDLSEYPNNYSDVYLLFDSYKLDSKNFVEVLSYFDNHTYRIKEVYPYINPMYQTMLSGVNRIPYDYDNLTEGIAGIYKTYLNELEEYRLTEEMDKVFVNGVRIRMLKINANNQVLKSFLKKYKGVKYSVSLYGLFKGF